MSDEQWERIKPHLPPGPHPRPVVRPRADDRACFEGILWVFRSGDWWKDLTRDRGLPSPATCWRRLARRERGGVGLRLWAAFLDALGDRGRLGWSECFAGGTFAAAKGGRCVVKTKRGKGTKPVVVADGRGVPLALTVHSASPSATRMIEPTPDRLGRQPDRLVLDRAFDGDRFATGSPPAGPTRSCRAGTN